MPKRRALSDKGLTDWHVLSVLLVFSCFAWSFSKNIKDFLKKFKDFFRKLLHIFRRANMAVGCWYVVPASVAVSFLFFEEDILFFTLLFFSLLCKRVVLKISWLRRCRRMIVAWLFHGRCVIVARLCCFMAVFFVRYYPLSMLFNIKWYMSVCRFYESCVE